ncbi:hypothetical protein GCM10010328_44950 [Streptomyces rubiginosohelvolus]|uniref:PIN domain-containing protein n=1 Tax=Streptomyces rubiginosohelvolus TaxID=67362 RepID=A0ABQ3C657_9ACTN|nr:hypothetical protein GCM10010328_44950 [Streptomyces pluricolorescens]
MQPGPSRGCRGLKLSMEDHKDAIDATVAEVALRRPNPVALLTTDKDDITKLCGNQVRAIPL